MDKKIEDDEDVTVPEMPITMLELVQTNSEKPTVRMKPIRKQEE